MSTFHSLSLFLINWLLPRNWCLASPIIYFWRRLVRLRHFRWIHKWITQVLTDLICFILRLLGLLFLLFLCYFGFKLLFLQLFIISLYQMTFKLLYFYHVLIFSLFFLCWKVIEQQLIFSCFLLLIAHLELIWVNQLLFREHLSKVEVKAVNVHLHRIYFITNHLHLLI